jgi:hypothetical protein
MRSSRFLTPPAVSPNKRARQRWAVQGAFERGKGAPWCTGQPPERRGMGRVPRWRGGAACGSSRSRRRMRRRRAGTRRSRIYAGAVSHIWRARKGRASCPPLSGAGAHGALGRTWRTRSPPTAPPNRSLSRPCTRGGAPPCVSGRRRAARSPGVRGRTPPSHGVLLLRSSLVQMAQAAPACVHATRLGAGQSGGARIHRRWLPSLLPAPCLSAAIFLPLKNAPTARADMSAPSFSSSRTRRACSAARR